jgi:hypothetical protein
MSSSVSTLLSNFEQGFNALIVHPFQDLHSTYVAEQERLFTLKAITPSALDHAADKIAEEVNAESRITPNTVRGVVSTKANNMNHGLRSKLAALQEDINKLKGVKGHTTKKERRIFVQVAKLPYATPRPSKLVVTL